MKIIVGIGNPGKKYAGTRHNIGFMAADLLAQAHGFGPWRKRFHALAAEGTVAGQKVLLMKPDTYVNESGRAVREAADWCRTAPEDIVALCDDFNLPLGRLRVRGGGSSGGHNGLRSIAERLGTEAFPRVRIGIGSEQRQDDRDFVLSSFLPEEADAVAAAVRRAAAAVGVWIEHGLERCQNEFNASARPGKEEEAKD